MNPIVSSPAVPSKGFVEVGGVSFLMDESPFKQVEFSRVCGVHDSLLSIDGSSEYGVHVSDTSENGIGVCEVGTWFVGLCVVEPVVTSALGVPSKSLEVSSFWTTTVATGGLDAVEPVGTDALGVPSNGSEFFFFEVSSFGTSTVATVWLDLVEPVVTSALSVPSNGSDLGGSSRAATVWLDLVESVGTSALGVPSNECTNPVAVVFSPVSIFLINSIDPIGLIIR